MLGPERERWRQLCEQIADEQDPARFSELVKELLAELEAKDKRLKKPSTPRVDKPSDADENEQTPI